MVFRLPEAAAWRDGLALRGAALPFRREAAFRPSAPEACRDVVWLKAAAASRASYPARPGPSLVLPGAGSLPAAGPGRGVPAPPAAEACPDAAWSKAAAWSRVSHPARPAPQSVARGAGSLPAAGRGRGVPARRAAEACLDAAAWSKAAAVLGAAPAPRAEAALQDGKPQAEAEVSRGAAAPPAGAEGSDGSQQAVAARRGAWRQVEAALPGLWQRAEAEARRAASRRAEAAEPDGRRAAAGVQDGPVRAWLPAPGGPPLPFPCPAGPGQAGRLPRLGQRLKPEPPARKPGSRCSPAIIVWSWSSSSSMGRACPASSKRFYLWNQRNGAARPWWRSGRIVAFRPLSRCRLFSLKAATRMMATAFLKRPAAKRRQIPPASSARLRDRAPTGTRCGRAAQAASGHR